MSAPTVPAPLARLPNALTVLRLLLVPVFCVVLALADGAQSWTAAAIFGAAGITDQLDGWLARRWRVESRFGRVADPLADRLMISAAVIILFVRQRLPWEAFLLVVGRDVLLVGGYRLLAPRGIEVSVNFLGKLGTWILYLALVCVMVSDEASRWPLWLFWGGLGVALVAAVLYTAETWVRLRRGETGRSTGGKRRIST